MYQMCNALMGIVLVMCTGSALARDVISLTGASQRQALEQLQGEIRKSPTDAAALKDAGIILHQMNRAAPNKDNVLEGEKYLKQASQLNPSDVETTAWLGSIVTMKAQFESDPGKQTFYVKLGTRNLDAAVQKAPENLLVRLIRANNSLELPPFLQRTRFAVEDFTQYIALCNTHACPPDAVTEARQKLQLAQKISAENK